MILYVQLKRRFFNVCFTGYIKNHLKVQQEVQHFLRDMLLTTFVVPQYRIV